MYFSAQNFSQDVHKYFYKVSEGIFKIDLFTASSKEMAWLELSIVMAIVRFISIDKIKEPSRNQTL